MPHPGDRGGGRAARPAADRGARRPGGPAPLSPSLEHACRRWASRPAVSFAGTTITYRQLWARISTLAGAYRRLGVGPADRVLCQLRNCPEHVVAIAAAWQCGAIHVGADNDLTGPELSRLVERLDAGLLLYQPPDGPQDPWAPLQAVRDTSLRTRLLVHGAAPDPYRSLADLPPPDGPPPDDRPRPLDDALVFLTSGTTGEPKAVVESLSAHWAKMQFFADGFAPGPDDVHLLFLPVSHVFGLRLALLSLLRGGRLILADRFSPARTLELVGDEQVTVLPAVPAHLRLLRDRFDPARHDLGSLRWVLSAASPLPEGLAMWVYDTVRARILYVYGCSEGFTMQTADADDIRAGSVGASVFRGPPGTPADGTVRVVDPDSRRRLPDGETGEVAFGAARPVRYWDQPPVATAGWYPTGDLGYRDEQGRIHLVGRLKELINRGGLHVSATEVELAVRSHADVADAAVIPTPDPVLGEAVCVCVVARDVDPPDLGELHRFLKPRLARHKLPDELCVVPAIPRTDIGKVDRARLARTVLGDGRPRERAQRR